MVDLALATNGVMGGRQQEARPSTAERLGPGLVHLDYGDLEHVFLVQVTLVPRRQLLTAPALLGDLDGVPVSLTGVEVANHVSVVLEGEPTGRGQSADTTAGWPGERLMRMHVAVTDDVGTTYTEATAEAGGEEHPWRAIRRYRPTPPPGAAHLRVHLTFAGGATPSVLTLPLSREDK